MLTLIVTYNYVGYLRVENMRLEQSSALSGSLLAVDGNVLTVSQTNATSDSWWRVDLGSLHLISAIAIVWNNSDQSELT